MILGCTAKDCLTVIDVSERVSMSATFTCRLHTKPGTDDVRFQTYQFDDKLIGSGTDPRAYEQRPQPKKTARKFPKTGRPRRKKFEKLKTLLEGVPNADRILQVLKQDLGASGE